MQICTFHNITNLQKHCRSDALTCSYITKIPAQSFLYNYLLPNAGNEEGIDRRSVIAACCLDGNASSTFRSRLYHAFPELAGQGSDDEVDFDDEDDDT